jgi:hypothetical protein
MQCMTPAALTIASQPMATTVLPGTAACQVARAVAFMGDAAPLV